METHNPDSPRQRRCRDRTALASVAMRRPFDGISTILALLGTSSRTGKRIMEFGILGPMFVRDDQGEELVISSARHRVLLASLLIKSNTLVPPADLIEAVWDGKPTTKARATLSSHVMRLRKRLGPDSAKRIRTLPSGYLIAVADDEFDLRRFLALGAAGRRAAAQQNWHLAADTLSQALLQWRGGSPAPAPPPALPPHAGHPPPQGRPPSITWWGDVSMSCRPRAAR